MVLALPGVHRSKKVFSLMTQAQSPKAIPAVYEGVRHRSRLEARWAKFFDLLDEPAIFEHEGFDLPSGPYLPDFYLPRLKLWVEIKPYLPSVGEQRLCFELCEATGERVVCAYGPLGLWLDAAQSRWHDRSGLAWLPSRDPDGLVVAEESERFWPCICPVCGAFGFSFEGDGGVLCASLGLVCEAKEKSYTFNHERITKAVRMANAESFWR